MIPNYTIPLWDIYTVRMPNKIKGKEIIIQFKESLQDTEWTWNQT